MPVVFHIMPSLEGDVSYNDPKAVVHYAVSGAVDDTALVQAIIAQVPPIWTVNGVDRFIDNYRYKEVGGGCWNVDVSYRKQPNSFDLNFDLSASSGKILQSLATIYAYDCVNGNQGVDPTAMIAQGKVKDCKRAIGDTGDTVDGCDVPLPAFNFSINARLKMSGLSDLYIFTMYDMAGKTNNAPYTINWKNQSMTFLTENLRFLGFTGKETSDDDLDISYKFSASQGLSPADNVTIGNSDPISKAGWNYVWVRYKKVPDAATGGLLNVPEAAYVERVSKTADFTLLAL
jgi:hypothetical protein